MLQQQTVQTGFDAKSILFIALAGMSAFYLYVLSRGIKTNTGPGDTAVPTPGGLATGFFTNFWDTLGIGSFATTTAIYRQWKMVRDERIPGTLNIGHTLPTIVQAFLFTTLVPVDPTTLVLMIVAAVAGSYLGAGIVSRWSRPKVQTVLGVALFLFAMVLTMKQLKLLPGGGTALALTGMKLVIGLVGNFALGALMTAGIGLYAPCMILIYLLGMDPKAAFPIMMGSCAFLMPVASARFVREKAFDKRAILALAIGGVPAVFLAFYVFSTLSITLMLWLVVVVVIYTSVTLLRSAMMDKDLAATATAEEAGAPIKPI